LLNTISKLQVVGTISKIYLFLIGAIVYFFSENVDTQIVKLSILVN